MNTGYPFRVVFYTADVNGMMSFKSYQEAHDCFETYLNAETCKSGYIMSNLTGELYAHFNKQEEGNGIKTEIWVATE